MAPTLVKALSYLSFASLAFTGVSANTNSSSSVCDTSSKCIPFTVDVSLGTSSGGVPREAILTNGTLPGPPLKMKVGDCVDFTVINNLPYVTAVHFHGIRQLGSAWADGTPGLAQTPIEPGDSYMYQWTADAQGTYFYHAHYKGQMMDGLFGAIVIEAADDAEKPFSAISSSDTDKLDAAYKELETVFVGDWSQFTFNEFFSAEKAANVDIACTDSIILNGMGSAYCPGVATLTANANPLAPQLLNGTSLTAKGCVPASNPRLQGNFSRNVAALPPGMYDQCTPYSGKNYTHEVDAADGWTAMSFINSGGFLLLQISIDSHKLYIFENDGNFVQPQIVDQIPIAAGDRVSFFVKLDQTPANYQIRVANSGVNQVISGFGVLSYKGASGFAGVASQNLGGVNTTTVTKFIPAKAAPFPAEKISETADKTFTLDIMKSPSQPADAWAWTLSGFESYNHSRDDADPPLLFQNPASIPDSDLILKTNFNEWVDLIIKIEGPLAQPHPMHKHGNKFYVLGSGVGPFPYTTVAAAQAAGLPINLATAPYVDGFTSTPANGNSSWMVFRYQANTPGAWFFHCHVQTHFSGGMAVAILDAVDQFPSIPSDAGDVCPGTGETSHSCFEAGTCSSCGGPNGGDYSAGEGSGSSGSGNGSTAGSGSSGYSSGSGSSGSGSSDGQDEGAFYPSATTSAGIASYTNSAGIATYTGAATVAKTSVSVGFGALAAVFFAIYA